MSDQEFMPVEAARELMCVGPGEMLMLLEAGALRYRKDQFSGAVKEISAEDVNEVVGYLTRREQEEKKLLSRPSPPPGNGGATEAREVYYFNLSDSDLLTLLLAVASYLDAERDLYFVMPDERGSLLGHLKVVSRLYERLERESRAGCPLSEIVEDIFERRPDQKARSAVFTYLMDRAKASGKRQ